MLVTERFRFLVEYLPLRIEFSELGHTTLRVALQSHETEPTRRLCRELCAVDGQSIGRVWHKHGSIPGWMTLLQAEEGEQQITHTYLQIVSRRRLNGRLVELKHFDGLTWDSVSHLSVPMQGAVQDFLRRELSHSPALPCRFLSPRWTVSEYRRVVQVITGEELDGSNAHKRIDRLVGQGLVRRTHEMAPTVTRHAATYELATSLYATRSTRPWLYFGPLPTESP